jgi:hypothetical protein
MSESAEAQLCLEIGEAVSRPEGREIDLVDTMIGHHGGNYRAVINELMEDAEFLRSQLYTASRLMSQGMGRGWRPKYERI